MKTHFLKQDPFENWMQVEMYLWQHGHLPDENSFEKVTLKEAMQGMARAISNKDTNHFPTPMQVIDMLNYASKYIKK